MLKVQFWHDFMRCVALAGYRTPRIISSQLALVFAYSLYLIGRTQIGQTSTSYGGLLLSGCL